MEFLELNSAFAAVRELLAWDTGEANERADAYMFWLQEAMYANATIARRLASLRRLFRLGRRYRFTTAIIDTTGPRRRRTRSTMGPPPELYRAMLEAAAARWDRKGQRDQIILRLAYSMGLRAQEILRLDIADVDTVRRKLRVLRKGEREPAWIDMPIGVADALATFIMTGGRREGPLLLGMSNRNAPGERLSYSGLAGVVKQLGRAVGVPCTPHGLRHAAATHLMTLTNGNVRVLASFLGHSSAAVSSVYDDQARSAADAVYGAELLELNLADATEGNGAQGPARVWQGRKRRSGS